MVCYVAATFCIALLVWFIPGLPSSAEKKESEPGSLRYIVIDGSNVAMR